jgi:hypothetical protein
MIWIKYRGDTRTDEARSHTATSQENDPGFFVQFLENDIFGKIQIAAQPFSIERMQTIWNRLVSQNRLKFCLQLQRDAVHE